MFILPMHCWKNQFESSEQSQSRRKHGPNMPKCRVGIFHHMEPFTLRRACGFAHCHPVGFITDQWTILMPTSWRNTSGIHRLRQCARPPVAGGARKGVVHALLDRTSVTYRHQGKFAQDTLSVNDIQDRFLVVKLVYHMRSNRLQPSYKKSLRNNWKNGFYMQNYHKARS